MAYYLAKHLDASFSDAIDLVTEALAKEGFGVLTKIDVKETLKKKLGVDFRPYTILGACNPGFAHKALTAEDKIGVMLPCNVIVQELENGEVEVAAVDPHASMSTVKNEALRDIAEQVRGRLKAAIDSL